MKARAAIYRPSAKHYHLSVMPVDTEVSAYTPVKAPRGNQITCKSWQQEAAMRMLMNNLDDGDEVVCRKAAHSVKLLQMHQSFFQVLREKLKWGERE